MDTAQWPQEIVVKPLEEIVRNTKQQQQGLDEDRKIRAQAQAQAQKEQAIVNCPRCNSTNTKFCYYNNYSLTQPRFFCKTCRRYWTQGGSLRNIPVGGGSRKNKRSSSSISSSSSPATKTMKLPDLVSPKIPEPPHHDLNLGFPQDFRTMVQGDPPQSRAHISPSALELLTGMSSSVQDPNSVLLYTNGFEFKPSLGFSLDGLGSGSYGGGGRLLFPFEDLNKQAPTSNNNNNNDDDEQQQCREQGGGYWSGMLGGGNW